jgi:hypothetical protein
MKNGKSTLATGGQTDLGPWLACYDHAKATPFSLLASEMLFEIIQHIKLRDPKNYNGLQVASDFGDQDAWSFDSM